ncbi:MAG: GAF domain-containing protein [Gemmatimonadetes bacterium]|nr:MAG: GAF domain-containing protein [Gemmatimonadota bacterium]
MASKDDNLVGKFLGKLNKPLFDKKEEKVPPEAPPAKDETPEPSSAATPPPNAEPAPVDSNPANEHETAVTGAAELLLEFTNMINSYLNYDDLLQEALRLMIKLTGARRGLIMTYDYNVGRPNFEVAQDKQGNSIAEKDFRFSTSVVERVIESYEPVVITDMEKDEELGGAHSVRMLQIQSVMCVPLKAVVADSDKPELLGLVYVDNNSVTKIFEQKDMEFLMALANQAGIALHNARVYSQLKKAHQELLELDRMKNDFVTITTHELHTPLTAIVGYLDLIEMIDLSAAPKILQEGIEIIKESVNTLSEKIREITQITQIDSNRLELKLQPVPLKDFMRTVCRQLAPFAKRRQQNFVLQLPKSLPIVRLDQDKITIVITNLVMNAIRFTPDEGQITVRAMTNSQDSDEVVISISDTGIGIAEKDFDRIFQPFVELGDVLSHRSGTIEFLSSGQGLGLAIAKGIVESHQGRIWVESEVKKGSTFYFTLPINPVTTMIDAKSVLYGLSRSA